VKVQITITWSPEYSSLCADTSAPSEHDGRMMPVSMLSHPTTALTQDAYDRFMADLGKHLEYRFPIVRSLPPPPPPPKRRTP